jgi:hypothetical protein
LEVTRGNDVIAVEDSAGLVSGDGHGHALGDARVNEVAYCRPAKVMSQPATHARLPASGGPRLPVVDTSPTLQPAGEMRKQVGDDPPPVNLAWSNI